MSSDVEKSVTTRTPMALGTEDAKALARAERAFGRVFRGDPRLLAEMRRELDAMMSEECRGGVADVEAVDAGGVPALRVAAPGVSTSEVLIWLHGGGYVMGSAMGYRGPAAAVSATAGMAVVVPDYRLAPEHPFPAAVDDARTVLAWAVETWGARSTVLAGDSAGGGLTLAALVESRDSAQELPAAAVVVSALADLTASGETFATHASSDVAISRRSVANLRSAYVGEGDAGHPRVSPLFADLSGLPPILLLASSRETLLDDSRRLADKISASGGNATLSVYPDTCHAWTLFADFMPRGRQALEEIGAFVRTVLARTSEHRWDSSADGLPS